VGVGLVFVVVVGGGVILLEGRTSPSGETQERDERRDRTFFMAAGRVRKKRSGKV